MREGTRKTVNLAADFIWNNVAGVIKRSRHGSVAVGVNLHSHMPDQHPTSSQEALISRQIGCENTNLLRCGDVSARPTIRRPPSNERPQHIQDLHQHASQASGSTKDKITYPPLRGEDQMTKSAAPGSPQDYRSRGVWECRLCKDYPLTFALMTVCAQCGHLICRYCTRTNPRYSQTGRVPQQAISNIDLSTTYCLQFHFDTHPRS